MLASLVEVPARAQERSLLSRLRRHRRPPVAPDQRATEDDLLGCYRLLLGREPDPAGLASHRRTLRHGIARDDLVRSFVTSAEFTRRFGLDQAAPSSETTEAELDGLTVVLPSDDWAIGQALEGSGDYEPHVWRPLARELVRGRDVVDVGANLGLIALRAAREVAPDGRVFAIEASIRNCRLLERSARRNALANLEILPVAAGDRRGMTGYLAHGSNGEIVALDESSGSTPVPMLPVDDLLPVDADVAVLKVDVEGYEPDVFAGARATIDRCRPVCFFELSPEAMHARTGVDAATLLGRCLQQGYEFRRLMRDDETTTEAPAFSESVADVLATLDGAAEPFDMMARPRR